MGKAIQKEWRELRAFVSSHRMLLLFAAALTVLCYAKNAFTLNVRVDSEVFINEPGTLQGWLYIGRFGQAIYKALLGNLHYNPYYSGVLFLIFFFASCVLWCYLFWVCAPRSRYFGAFAALYLTSQTWAFMFYFTMMAAEVALGIASVPLALLLVTRALDAPIRKSLLCYPAAVLLLAAAFAAYQAIVSLTITGAAACLLLWESDRLEQTEKPLTFKRFFIKGAAYAGTFCTALLLYQFISRTFFSGSGYLTGQIRWNYDTVENCFHWMYEYLYATLTGLSYEYSIAFTVGILLTGIWFLSLLVRKSGADKIAAVFLTLAVLIGSPYFMMLLMGGYPVARTQFSLPFCAAFLFFFCVNRCADGKWGRGTTAVLCCAAALLSVFQTSILMRLFYTDDIRFRQDVALGTELVEEITEQFGETDLPVVFIGERAAPLNKACKTIDIYGVSIFVWDFVEVEPSSNTERVRNFIWAALGTEFTQPSMEQRVLAVEAAREMPVFPNEGSVIETEGVIVVNLGFEAE